MSEYKLSANSLNNKIYMDIFYSHPELFYFQTYRPWGIGNKVVYIEIVYKASVKTVKQKVKQYNAEVDSFAKTVNRNWSDAEKALYIANFLCDNAAYDYGKYNAHMAGTLKSISLSKSGAYSVLVKGMGVCHDYACAYMALAKKIGLKTLYVRSDKLNHGWVLVRIGKKYYHVDPTWMDGEMGQHNTKNFMKSNNGITLSHKANDFIVEGADGKITVGGEFDNLFESNPNATSWAYAGGYWYAFDRDARAIKRYKYSKNVFTDAGIVDELDRDCFYSSVASYGGYLYYAKCYTYSDPEDEGIYRYNPIDGKKEMVYKYNAGQYDQNGQNVVGFGGVVIDKKGYLSVIAPYNYSQQGKTCWEKREIKNVMNLKNK